jgi:formate C-acetyltransferase
MPTAIRDFTRLISTIRQTKLEFNDRKLAGWGHNDVDDHGWIPLDQPTFEPEVNPETEVCSGPLAIGRSFRGWLGVHPLYIHPQSAVAGAWVCRAPGVGDWAERPEHLAPIWERYNIRQPGATGMNHLGPDMRIGLDLGFGGLLRKIRRYRRINRPDDPSFYDGEEEVVLGMQEFVRRHAEEAERRAVAAGDGGDRETARNYEEIAAINFHLVDEPPRTLREAVQYLAWFQTFDRMYFLGGAMQQIDTLLLPYYEADRAAGRIENDEEVVWYLVSLLFNDTHYHQIGGPAPADGRDVTNPVSFAMLDATHALGIPSNLAVRLHDRLDDALLTRAVEYLFEDGTGASFSCSGGLDEAFAKNGYPIELARMRAKVGCNWTALPGIEYCLQDVTRLCLVSPFLHSFYEMVGRRPGGGGTGGSAAGGPTDPGVASAGAAGGECSLELLWDGYARHLAVAVDAVKRGFDWHYEHKRDNVPEMVLNLFCHGPIERGLDASAGGVDIYNFTMDGVGLATVADSLAAIEKRVVEEEKLSWRRLAELLQANFEGQEASRLMLRNIPRYGTGGSAADRWADRVAALFTGLVKESPTPVHRLNVIPGLFSHGVVRMLGENLGATPNGRFAGTEISHSADPDPGFAADGTAAPTAKSNAVARVQPGWGNSAPLQVDMDSMLAAELGGVEIVKAYLKAHNKMGGTLVNINVISKEKLLAAHENPDLYPDLVVRVTGYSAFFKSLSYEYRQQVVDRFLAGG